MVMSLDLRRRCILDMAKTRFTKYMQSELSRPVLRDNSPVVLDLFAGCGGLALGFEAQGFHTVGIEANPDAAATYDHNLAGRCLTDFLVVGYDYPVKNPVAIIGGPPCQPFSVGGLQKGLQDSRDGFPIFLDAVKRLRPRVAIFENVRGMLYRNRDYLEEILIALREHGYVVEMNLLNAVNYGVPQRRERLFVVAHLGGWEWPLPLDTSFTAGEALGEMAYAIPDDAKFLTKSMDAYVAKYEKKSHCITPRDLHLDQPSRTVTCRNLHGATGDMQRVRLPDGRRRRLSPREGARLQSFPDWFHFIGTEGSQFNQIGNAVPPLLAKVIARSVEACLKAPRLSLAAIKQANIPAQPEFNFVGRRG